MSFVLPVQFLLFFLLLFAAITPKLLLLAFTVVFVLGVACGYLWRTAIASEISKFKVATIVSRLENTAKTEATVMREQIENLADELKKVL